MIERETKQNKNLRRAIVETIAFFDLFSFPLTINEVLKYLKVESDYLKVAENLNQLIKEGKIEKNEGLYFLLNRSAIIEERKKRYNYSDRKFKIALKIAKYFRFIPWIRLICVVNLIGRDNLRNGSDIDLFIVGERNRLWLTRFFTVLTAKILNVRPQKNNTKDKICLSFFVSEDSLDLNEIREGRGDIYFNYWFLNLVPIYFRADTYEKLIESNKKIFRDFPNYYPQKISNKRNIKKFTNSFYKKNLELFFGGLEKTIKQIQLKIMPKNLRNLAPKRKGVIITDKIIKLHLGDRREEFLKKYNEKISKISI
jgi:hypothetical protein